MRSSSWVHRFHSSSAASQSSVASRIAQIEKRVSKLMSKILHHLFLGQKVNVRLKEEQENCGFRSYLYKVPDPLLAMNWECPSRSPRNLQGHIRVPKHNDSILGSRSAICARVPSSFSTDSKQCSGTCERCERQGSESDIFWPPEIMGTRAFQGMCCHHFRLRAFFLDPQLVAGIAAK